MELIMDPKLVIMNIHQLTSFIQVEIAIVNSKIPRDEFDELVIKAWKESLHRIEFQSKLNADSYSIANQHHWEVEECAITAQYVKSHITEGNSNLSHLLATIGEWKESLERISKMMSGISQLQAAINRVAKEEK